MNEERLNFINKLRKEKGTPEIIKNADHGRQLSKIGHKCVISDSAVIGVDGYGWERDRDGTLVRFPHYGSVIIEDSVEIRPGVVIDRGNTKDTIIREGTKIDDLAHIAHNCIIGRHCLIHAQVNICGSVEIGDRCEIFPLTNIQPNVRICDDVTIGDGSIVREDITVPGTYVYAGGGKMRRLGEKKKKVIKKLEKK